MENGSKGFTIVDVLIPYYSVDTITVIGLVLCLEEVSVFLGSTTGKYQCRRREDGGGEGIGNRW